MNAADVINLLGRVVLGTLRFRRGAEADLPTLKTGEPAFTTDTYKLFVGSDAGNKQIAGGRSNNVMPTAIVKTIAALPTCTYANGTSGVGATLTMNSVGVVTVNSRALQLNDIVLVTEESSALRNGLYQVTTAGTVSVAAVLTRHVDCDEPTDFLGAIFPVGVGGGASELRLTFWSCTAITAPTIGTTAISITLQYPNISDGAGGGGSAFAPGCVVFRDTFGGLRTDYADATFDAGLRYDDGNMTPAGGSGLIGLYVGNGAAGDVGRIYLWDNTNSQWLTWVAGDSELVTDFNVNILQTMACDSLSALSGTGTFSVSGFLTGYLYTGKNTAYATVGANQAFWWFDSTSGKPAICYSVADSAGVKTTHTFCGIRADGRFTAQTAAKAIVATISVGAADASFEVCGNIRVTTATTHSFTMTCTYTDEGSTSRTLTLSFTLVAGGTLVTSIANANGAVPYMGIPQRIRAKSGTNITLATTGTFTTVTYNVEGSIEQLPG